MLTGAGLPEDSSWDGRLTSQWPCSYGCWSKASPQDRMNVLTVWWLASFQKNHPKGQGEGGDGFTHGSAESLGHTGQLCSAWGELDKARIAGVRICEAG